MKFTDEQLMAYADGELDAATRLRIDAAIAKDPVIAAAVERHRRLRRRVHAAYDPVLAERVPDRLLAAAKTLPAANNSTAQVVELAVHRHKMLPLLRRWSWPEWGAIAASLIVGVIAGQAGWRAAPGDLFATRNGELVARSDLSAALSDRLASEPANQGIRIALSFRSKQGQYCRAFTVAPPKDRSSLAGVACRDGNEWHMQTLARQAAEAASGATYRQAASALPASVLSTVSDMMEGDALDVSAESAARATGWHE